MKRSITSAIVAGALLAGVACSGGGVAPQSGPKIQLTTPKSVSPALIKAPPMVLTAVLPASAMTSRRPATAIEPQSWAQIPGSATQVAAAADGSLWVLSDQPAGPDKAIWHYVAGTWTNIPGAASQISVAPNGTLNVINSAGGIYAYSGGTWTSPGGGAKSITTLVDNSIVVVSSQGSGDQGLWRNDGSGWQQLGGSGVAVYAGEDTVPHTVGGNVINPNGVYILNNAGQIYYENSDSSFAQLPESASSLASRPGGVFAVASGALGPNGNAIYYFDLDSPGWTAQTGTASSLSVGANNVLFAVSGSGAIYQTNTDSPTPVPTPTATPTPTPTATPTATPTPANTLAVNPNPISLLQTGASTVGVTEAGFSGSITAVSSDTSILTVASSPVTMTAGTATINVTAVASGSTTLTVSDGTQTVLVPVHVTITGVIIGTAGHR